MYNIKEARMKSLEEYERLKNKNDKTIKEFLEMESFREDAYPEYEFDEYSSLNILYYKLDYPIFDHLDYIYLVEFLRHIPFFHFPTFQLSKMQECGNCQNSKFARL